ncbi:hypothetical protein R3P38DRAFT_2816357 [Favolaschia claudopus]|uniref:Uncharacterized protein n=1 Tax=Favolaschia claudopus TaxID=2862362 RepID=A0AAV9YZ43_9AGAR
MSNNEDKNKDEGDGDEDNDDDEEGLKQELNLGPSHNIYPTELMGSASILLWRDSQFDSSKLSVTQWINSLHKLWAEAEEMLCTKLLFDLPNEQWDWATLRKAVVRKGLALLLMWRTRDFLAFEGIMQTNLNELAGFVDERLALEGSIVAALAGSGTKRKPQETTSSAGKVRTRRKVELKIAQCEVGGVEETSTRS